MSIWLSFVLSLLARRLTLVVGNERTAFPKINTFSDRRVQVSDWMPSGLRPEQPGNTHVYHGARARRQELAPDYHRRDAEGHAHPYPGKYLVYVTVIDHEQREVR